jgi:3-hydroxymyristoyl/3-hydroxydecanoyl-(acyl carrier protein) dehydratase
MRWRLVDRVTDLEPWQRIAGVKAVSLEEYYLLEPLGRQGVFPESLVIECCQQMFGWLVAASSDFETAAVLDEVDTFTFHREATMGQVLTLELAVSREAEGRVSADCRVTAETGPIASGRLGCVLVPLAEGADPGELRGAWQEIHGTA